MLSIRGDFAEGMKKNMYAWFFETYDQVPTVYDQIFKVVNSDGAYDQSTKNSSLSDLVEKPEGNDIVFQHVGEGRVIIGKNRTFTSGFELSKEAVEDFPVQRTANIMKEYANQWGEAVRRSKEKFAAKFFNRGGYLAGDDVFNNTISGVVVDASGNFIYDGKPFFSLTGTAHPSLNGGTYINSVALTLSSTNLITVNARMTSNNNRDENDEVISNRPDTLLVPPALGDTARVILNTEFIPGSTNNDINVNRGRANLVEWDYLTDTAAWFLGQAKKGLVWTERQQPIIEFFQDSRNKNYYCSIDARWGAYVTDFRPWIGGNVATS